MKFRYHYILAAALIILTASCNKDHLQKPGEPSFDVTTDATTYKAGQTITFNINCDADIVAFYSGEPQKEFDYRNGRIIDNSDGGAKLSFNSGVSGGTQGTLSATAPPQLAVLASTDFNGQYDYANVTKATWTDITARFKYATTATLITSTSVDVSDLLVAGKPIYFAYKYITKPQAINGTARSWFLEAFTLVSKKNIGTTNIPVNPTIVNQILAGFRIVDQNPTTAPARSSVSSSRVTLLGNLYDPVNDPGNDPQSENWAVSTAINTASINLGNDKSVAIKDQEKSTPLTNYTFSYAQPGTYKATFVASNNTVNSTKEVVKQIVLTITP
ncbi:DUF5017 domain-containing protein [Mucilaginibacter boryungensis]|uniref:DUF5017 domain-containing protein n=1 Tax=Mucilaginibacter boryungensis TaxID=768480 RepID=A0ABR9XK05_9SPHI|nr:DUF5017 domain-containing protein [Mucilaginibacter boryungensis]MBE9667606.1 DUF5017 domain-containing protein [Mucilaginibacter boryungensis]